jgi:threonine synthase
VKRGLTYSSGNAGASFAAYSARAGFPGLVLVEYLASPTKQAMILLYGANSAILHFRDFEQITKLMERASGEMGCYTFVNFINPIRHEAMKTYAYEIYTELGRAPDWSFHGVGTGGGLYGAWKGYGELAELGVSDRIPHMVSVQPESVAWVKEAMDTGAAEGKAFGEVGHTIAQSIGGNSPLQGGRRLLRCLRESGGLALGVSDDEIREAMADLGREGIAAEPSSAATVAAFKQAVKAGRICSDETVVCTITGTAFKQPKVVEQIASAPEYTVEAEAEDLEALLQKLGMM